jgi:Lrp/AsnC family leucine-responsive transcriptional regulator
VTVDLDDIDLDICEALAWDGRLSYRELGDRIGLSSPATADRVRRLEQRGVITGYRATIDYEALGFPILSIVRLNNSYRSDVDIDAALADVPEIIEANRVTGAESHVIRARVRSTSHLEDLLKVFWNQADTVTNIVTSSPIHRRPMLLRRALGRG